MKFLITIFTIWVFSTQVYSQPDKLTYSFDYTPTNSKITYGLMEQDFKFSHQFFIKAGYGFSRKTNLTVGLGYMNVNEMRTINLDGQLDIEYIESFIHRNYIIAPVGVKYSMGSFFIHPEIGFGINVYNVGPPVKQISYLSNGEVVVQRYNDNFSNREYNRFTFPAYLTIGKEINLKKTTLLLGLKGYYSLESIAEYGFQQQHYLGFGASLGVRF